MTKGQIRKLINKLDKIQEKLDDVRNALAEEIGSELLYEEEND